MLTSEMITHAAERLQDLVLRTPLIESPLLNSALGFRILIKSECLQKTGSFKIRGAYNKIISLNKTQREAGVVAYSSGNHAQGVAAAASVTGVAAKIVMPSDAPRIKLENTARWGPRLLPMTDKRVTVQKSPKRSQRKLGRRWCHLMTTTN